MARKTLLNESELRRFMRLASLTPLGAGKLQEMGYGHDEEDDLEEDLVNEVARRVAKRLLSARR